jgi:hypothetical protein
VAFSAATSFTLLSNLQSLAHLAAKGLGSIGTGGTSYIDDACSFIKVTTGATVSPNGQIVLFLVTSEDGTNWTDGIDPTATGAGSNQSTKIAAGSLNNIVFRIGAGGQSQLAASTTYFFPGFSVVSILGFRPVFWSPVVWNVSGGALSATAGDFFGKHVIQT